MNTIAEREVICEELGCNEDATTFDSTLLEFRCDTHPATEAGGSGENS